SSHPEISSANLQRFSFSTALIPSEDVSKTYGVSTPSNFFFLYYDFFAKYCCQALADSITAATWPTVDCGLKQQRRRRPFFGLPFLGFPRLSLRCSENKKRKKKNGKKKRENKKQKT